jgi:SMI1/KNR4 family protein SUKH-1
MTLQDLKGKHNKLKKLDGGRLFKSATYKTFGSDTHRYKFNPCLTDETLQNFEKTHSITLPSDYRNFLIQIGNGGSGPAYGLFALSDWNFKLEIDDNNFLATEFPHTDKWNITKDFDHDEDYIKTEEFQKWEQEYYSNKHITGSMIICHYGCAIYYLLVVTGKEAGNIWVDDRASDYGIYPAISKSTGGRLTFIEWYDEWLTESLNQFA